MSVEDDIEAAGEQARKAMLEAAAALGVDARAAGALLAHLILGEIPVDGGQSVKVVPKLRAQALQQFMDLSAAVPKRTQRVHSTSEQRVLKLTLGDGQLPGIDLDALKKLPPEQRAQFIETLKVVRIGAGEVSAAALPPTAGSGGSTEG